VASQRNIVLVTDSFYHVYNRGVERRPVFINRRGYQRAKQLIDYYLFSNVPVKFSRFYSLSYEKQQTILLSLTNQQKLVDLISYCLMPNHFHFLLRQRKEKGIATFISKFTNAYTKYFNTRYDRVGPLFQGIFKAVYVETDEQLLHLSRYIHLNPVTSSLINLQDLQGYEWSSFPVYSEEVHDKNINKQIILSIFPSIESYKRFVFDQADYAKTIHSLQHLSLE